VELLRQAENDVGELVKCVQKFATWWDQADTTISDLKRRVVSADDLTIGELRIGGIRESWEDVEKHYKEYKTCVSIFSLLQYNLIQTILVLGRYCKLFLSRRQDRIFPVVQKDIYEKIYRQKLGGWSPIYIEPRVRIVQYIQTS
jgi:hypothetical protein